MASVIVKLYAVEPDAVAGAAPVRTQVVAVPVVGVGVINRPFGRVVTAVQDTATTRPVGV